MNTETPPPLSNLECLSILTDSRLVTPEEAVAHCREVAARLGDTPCARDHLQLAEWIEERDRLRDLVRRLLPLAETTVENIRALGTARFPFMEQIKSDRLRGDINREVSNADHLLREARAAIGEDAK